MRLDENTCRRMARSANRRHSAALDGMARWVPRNGFRPRAWLDFVARRMHTNVGDSLVAHYYDPDRPVNYFAHVTVPKNGAGTLSLVVQSVDGVRRSGALIGAIDFTEHAVARFMERADKLQPREQLAASLRSSDPKKIPPAIEMALEDDLPDGAERTLVVREGTFRCVFRGEFAAWLAVTFVANRKRRENGNAETKPGQTP